MPTSGQDCRGIGLASFSSRRHLSFRSEGNAAIGPGPFRAFTSIPHFSQNICHECLAQWEPIKALPLTSVGPWFLSLSCTISAPSPGSNLNPHFSPQEGFHGFEMCMRMYTGSDLLQTCMYSLTSVYIYLCLPTYFLHYLLSVCPTKSFNSLRQSQALCTTHPEPGR